MARETEVERLLVRLIGDATQYQKMLADAKNSTKKNMAQIGQSISRFGRSISLRITAPLAIMGAASVKAFSNFDKAMIESTSIMKVTAEQTAEMRDVALELSSVAAQGPKDLAEAYFFLASAGKDAEQSMALLPKVSQFATAGAFDMALATDLLTDAQSALGLSMKDAAKDTENMARVSDVLVKANTLANASVRQFSVSLTSKTGAALKAYNKDVEEGVAVLAAMADQGIKAELAGNALDRMIRLMSKSTLDNAKAHKQLGFRVFDSTGKMRNFADIIGNLEDILGSMSDQQKVATLDMLGFEARVQGVILPLLGTSDAIREYERELRLAKGTTDEVANKQMKSFANQMKLVRNQVTAVAIEIGRLLIPVIKTLTSWVKGAVDVWNNLSDGTKAALVQLGLVVGVIGPMVMTIGTMVGLVGQLHLGYTSLAKAAATSAKAQMFLAASTWAVRAAVIGLAAVGIGLLLKALYDAVTKEVEFNEALEKSASLTKQLLALWGKQESTFFADVRQLPAKEQEAAVAAEIERTSGAIQAKEASKERVIARAGATNWFTKLLPKQTREGLIERLPKEDKKSLENLTAQIKQLKEHSQKLRKEEARVPGRLIAEKAQLTPTDDSFLRALEEQKKAQVEFEKATKPRTIAEQAAERIASSQQRRLIDIEVARQSHILQVRERQQAGVVAPTLRPKAREEAKAFWENVGKKGGINIKADVKEFERQMLEELATIAENTEPGQLEPLELN